MLLDLVMKNRSYRNFDATRRITAEELEHLVSFARLCPSASNMQTLKYCLSCSERTNRLILAHIRFAGALPDRRFPTPGMEAAGYVVICHDMHISPNAERFYKDVGIVAQTMMLAAAEMGLGGCMVGSMNKAAIAEIFSLPDYIIPQLILVLGKPAENVEIVTAEGEDVTYYRREDDTHIVPKRSMDTLIIRKES